jgi:ABC-type transport system involved in cytochrome c biogenesis permease subunit
VSTLYETVLFVTAAVALVALVLEWIDRKRIAGAVAAFAGTVGLFIANGYETLDAKDTMPSLVAVLDTNFWLATHVTAITIGYSAGMLAALLGSVHVILALARAVRRKTDEADERLRSLARMTYGVLCFGLLFSIVGTILGGIWANESWGRFWGWDPKENGALLIVISQLAILHARQGGILRDGGVATAAAASGCVVAFSWWGVNLLGVGLHSYGFTSGIQQALTTYYLLQGCIVAAGLGLSLRARLRRKSARAGSRATAVPAPAVDLREAA